MIVSAISLLFAGVIYAWSILKAPLAAEFGWTPSNLALNFTLTMCFFCIGGILSGLAQKKFKLRYILIAAAVLSCAGLVLVSTIGQQIIQLYIFYGVLGGLGIGIAYNAILSATNAWFPDKKGLSSGVQMMAFGLSSLLLGNVAGYFIESPSIGWRTTFIILGVCLGVVLLLASFVLRFPPQGTVFPEAKAGKKRAAAEQFEQRDYTTIEMLKRGSFWRFFLFSVTLTAVGNTVISIARDLALSAGASAALAVTLVGVLAVCNGLGRLLSGMMFDAAGRKVTMLTGNIITIIAPAIILLAVMQTSVPLCVIGLCLAGLSYGFSPSISSTFTMSFYGTKNFATNFSIANTLLIPASFVATLAGELITRTGSYTAAFILLLALAVCSLLLNFSIRRP